MKRLKICLTALSCYPDVKDGASYNIRGIFDGLKQRGHDVTFYTGLWNQTLNTPGIIQLPIARKRFIWLPQFVAQVARKVMTNRFDIIHSNGSRSSLPLILTNQRYITTIHDFGPFEAKFTKFPIMPFLERLNANRAIRIAIVSEVNRRGIWYYTGEKNARKSRVILNSIASNFYPQPERAQRLREQYRIQGPVIFYVGRIAFYKGIEDIIKAYYHVKKHIPDLTLMIGGKAELKMQDTYRIWKTQYPDVKFLGLITPEELPAYYSLADAFVTYSFASEGFGLTPIEALSCGTPVICSTLAAYREVLQNHAIFVPPQQPEKLANAIVDLLKDESKRKQMVKDAKPLLELYTPKTVIDRVEKIYEELV
ncbi:MAG: group 1 glycosyl transferase [Promethearchaeota archaeon CR_4]|nr:MAG: group 1 glycosyl transferase [Candidatus Lokiarchaeota archaeon CR_4]